MQFVQLQGPGLIALESIANSLARIGPSLGNIHAPNKHTIDFHDNLIRSLTHIETHLDDIASKMPFEERELAALNAELIEENRCLHKLIMKKP